MSERETDRTKGGIKGDNGRADRLAAELRRNLHRRKQRARALAAQQETPPAEAEPAPGRDTEKPA